MGALFALAAFTSAWLAFAVQPLAGKLILPHFGGAPDAWLTCLLFFQFALFVGYWLAHLGTRLPPGTHVKAHLGLTAIVLVYLFFIPPSGMAPFDSSSVAARVPALVILRWLIAHFGPGYFLLATTAPLLQHWLGHLRSDTPLYLYAASNLGSLTALAAYPLVVEPYVDLQTQLGAYLLGIAIFGAAMLALGIAVLRSSVNAQPVAQTALFRSTLRGSALRGSTLRGSPLHGSTLHGSALHGVTPRRRMAWLGLAALPSLLLIATTHHVTLDVAGGPLLWVLPLAVYLLSFILAFGPLSEGRAEPKAPWRRWLGACFDRLRTLSLFAVSSVALGVLLLGQGGSALGIELSVSLLALFAAALLLHCELVQRRPADSELTRFYIWIAGGGALGSFIGSVLAPSLLESLIDLPLGLLGTLLALGLCLRKASPTPATRGERLVLNMSVGVMTPLMLALLYVQSAPRLGDAEVLARDRNFFGLLKVARFPDRTVLTHGRILHGMQWNAPSRSGEPTLYFGRSSAAGRVLTPPPGGDPRHVGVLGLGVGTLAAYGRPGDAFRFYEIDPAAVTLAREHFSFLKESAASVTIVLGDARQRLAEERPLAFDVLVLDAFSSDSVPTHLLTVQAFSLYLRHLKDEGLLLANASNRHLAVERVLAGSARALGLAYRFCETPENPRAGLVLVRWVVLARTAALLERALGDLPCFADADARVTWTDERSSVLPLLR